MSDPRKAMDVLVVLGTDIHPFQRAVDWIDAWARAQADAGTPRRVMVQHGHSAAPTYVEGRQLIPHDELVQLMSEAAAVVTHGGPATIVEVRSKGKRPIVVPRDPALGEHVDGHQQLFTARFAERGLVSLCRNETDFTTALDHALADPEDMVVTAAEVAQHDAEVARAVARTGEIVDAAVQRRFGRKLAPRA